MNKKLHKYPLSIPKEKFKKLKIEAEEIGISINALINLKLDNKIKN